MKIAKRAKFSGCFTLGLKNIFGVLDNPKRAKSSPKRAKLASLIKSAQGFVCVSRIYLKFSYTCEKEHEKQMSQPSNRVLCNRITE